MENNKRAFFELIKAGLWGNGNLDIRIDGTTDWQEVYRLATEQSVLGLVLAGLEHSDVKPPQVLLLQWIGEVQMIEQRNKAMNAFVAETIGALREQDIYALLVKGQGIAQSYEKPLWRPSGDIDFFLSKENYGKAVDFFKNKYSNNKNGGQYSKEYVFVWKDLYSSTSVQEVWITIRSFRVYPKGFGQTYVFREQPFLGQIIYLFVSHFLNGFPLLLVSHCLID